MKIFVSFGHEKHGSFVKRLVYVIEEKTNGEINILTDHKYIAKDAHWRRNITEEIIESDGVLAFLSEYSPREREICLDELAIALSLKHGMIKTILLEPKDSFYLPATVSEYQWGNMSDYPEYEKKGEAEYSAYISEKADKIIKMLSSNEIKQYNREARVLRQKLFLPEIPLMSRFDRLPGNEMSGREWLNDKIQKWLDDDNAERILMIYGKPGTGKTMFCAHMQHYAPFAAAVFACDYKSDEYSDTESIIRRLAYKLAMRLPGYRSRLISLFEDSNFNPGTGKDMFNNLIAMPLEKCSAYGQRGRMAIIIDALDEAGSDELAEFVTEYTDMLSPWLRFVITSGKETEITEKFEKFPSIDLDCYENENRNDLNRYFLNRLGDSLIGYTEKDKIIDRLAEACKGEFTYAECICRFIIDELNKHSLSLMDCPLPGSIEDLFENMLDRQFYDKKEYEYFWKEPLGMIIASPEPIPAKTLKKLMNWGDNKLRKFLRPFSGLIINENGRLRVFHKSFGEWLGSTDTEYCSDIENGINNLAERCYDVYDTGIEHMDGYMLLYTACMLRKAGQEIKYNKLIQDNNFINAVREKTKKLYMTKQFSTALKYISELIRILENADTENPEAEKSDNYARALYIKGIISEHLNKLEDSLKIYKSVSENYSKLSDRYPENIEYMKCLSDIYGAIAGIYQKQGNLPDALEIYNKSLDIRENIAEMYPENTDYAASLSSAFNSVAGIYEKKNDFAEAMEYYTRSLEIFEEISQENPGNSEYHFAAAVLCDNIAHVYKMKNDLNSAYDKYNEALKIYEELADKYPLMIRYQYCQALSSGYAADILKVQGELTGALDLYGQAYDLLKKIEEKFPENIEYKRDVLLYLNRKAEILAAENDLNSALKLYSQASDILKDLTEKYPENSGYKYDLSVSVNHIADILKAQNDFTKASGLYRQALETAREMAEMYPENHEYLIHLSVLYKNSADILETQKDISGALKLYNLSLETEKILAEKYPENHECVRGLSVSYEKIADILKARNDLSGALSSYEQAIGIIEKMAEKFPEDTDYIKYLSALHEKTADILKAQNNLPGALNSYDRVLKTAEKMAEKHSENTDYIRDLSVSYEKTADILKAQNDLSGALKLYNQSIETLKDLAEKYPENPDYIRDLSVSYEKTADILKAQNDLTGALRLNSQALEIRNKLSEKYPQNSLYQYDLAVSYENIADVLAVQSDSGGAFEIYRQSLEINKKLTEKYPENIDYLKKLSVLQEKSADILKSQNDLPEALEFYNQAIDISEKLCNEYPENVKYQLDAACLYVKSAGIHEADKKFQEALKLYDHAFEIRIKLLEEYPENPEYQSGVAYTLSRVAGIHKEQNNISGALKLYDLVIKMNLELTEKYPENIEYYDALAGAYYNYAAVSGKSEYKNKALAIAEKNPDMPQGRQILASMNQ